MAELIDVLDAFSTPLKIGWVIWVAWGIGQVFWYRHERKPRMASARTAPVRKPFVSKPSVPERVGTRLVTPEQVIVKQSPALDPAMVDASSSLIDGPGKIGELDRFVADFEMNTRQRGGQPHNGEPFDTHASH